MSLNDFRYNHMEDSHLAMLNHQTPETHESFLAMLRSACPSPIKSVAGSVNYDEWGSSKPLGFLDNADFQESGLDNTFSMDFGLLLTSAEPVYWSLVSSAKTTRIRTLPVPTQSCVNLKLIRRSKEVKEWSLWQLDGMQPRACKCQCRRVRWASLPVFSFPDKSSQAPSSGLMICQGLCIAHYTVTCT